MADRLTLDTTRVVLAIGKPGNLSRVTNETWTIKKIRRKFASPSVDSSMTFAKYQKLKKIADTKGHAKQKEAADLILSAKAGPGNWTAARYASSRRKVGDVEAKTAIVLDADHATPGQTQDIRNGFVPAADFAWIGHTSRSHCPEKPKFRMLFPTTREMTVAEAHAITRILSTYLADDPQEGIEIVDAVSFRTNQTMFWPSISKGQDYWTEENPGRILDPDEFLANHPGWEDHLNLPFKQAEHDRGGLKDPSRKMENPREKPNPIGAFCRAYPVEDAIETFLEEVYLPGTSETETRYTYAAGGSYNGAVVYDEGLFLHSNHESDPIQGSANAWDLVRVHKFGHLDDKVRDPEQSPTQLPSYKEMVKLAQRDPRVAAEEFARLDEVLDDDLDDDDSVEETADSEHDRSDVSKKSRFDDILDDDDEDGGSGDPADMLDDLPDDDEEPEKKAEKETPWQSNFRRKANGDLDPTAVSNITLICENDRRIAPCLAFNEFTQDPVILKPVRAPKVKLPSPPVDRKDRKHGRRITDADDRSIMLLSSVNAERGGYETDFSIEKVQTGVLAAGKQKPVHPVKDFIEAQHRAWKKAGSPRGNLERLAIDYLGCPDTAFHRESAVMFLVGAVARIYEPGCKFDVMAIIEGATGSRKSTFWQVLFGGFCNELKAELNDQGRLIEDIRGMWAKEMAEMDIAKRADANTLKMQLSSASDTFRMAYGRREQTFPRQLVFVGTSNERDYLKDPTSNRRFWVWKTLFDRRNPIDIDLLRANLHLIWGEAYALYLEMREAQPEGELWLDLQSKEAIDQQEQIAEQSRKRTAAEEIALLIEEWLDERHPADAVMVDPIGVTLDGYEGDETPMVRNMVTAKEAFIALRNDPVMHPYRNADVRTFGKALSLVPGWMEMSKCRRHGTQAVWYRRADGPDHALWVEAPDEDLIG